MNSFDAKMTYKKSQKLADDIADILQIDSLIYDAFASIPREVFVPDALKRHAYKLDALPLQEDQWISSPLTVAKMTVALKIKDVDSVLEVGCGSGYQAAILSKMVRRVFTIERIEPLLKEAKERFAAMRFNNIHVKFDDGQRGWRGYAPFDRILFSASIKSVPNSLFEQLRDGGILVAPIEKDGKQIITRFTKNGSHIAKEEMEDCFFVPVLDGTKR